MEELIEEPMEETMEGPIGVLIGESRTETLHAMMVK